MGKRAANRHGNVREFYSVWRVVTLGSSGGANAHKTCNCMRVCGLDTSGCVDVEGN